MDPRQPAARVASARATAVAAGLTGLAVLACDGGPPAAPPGFELHPDFEMQLVASEPVVFDPVDLDFDEEGRIWVLEMPGYPFPTEQGRVVRLEDADGDGTWETRTVFADGLGVADSILPVRGGLLVAAPPDLLLLRDRDGDGRGEEREVLLSGFASGNTQHNVNGLTHGIDNWIYGANGGNGGEVCVPGDDARVRLGFNDFRLRLDGPTFEITGRSSGGFEMTFDTWGRSYSTHNLYHLSQLVFPARYLPEGLPAGLHDTRQRLASEDLPGPVRIYPIGRQETRVNHPEQSGHFSGACGVTAYTGGAFGPAFDDNLLVADVVLNLVHRAVPETQGAAMGARRARPGVEFLASTDRAFRPVNLTVGPDGALYVLDMHRAVIEHPEWIPDEIEATLDLEAGKGQGRIYRIAPRAGLVPLHTIDFEPLDRDSPESLVGLLAHSNQWWRMTAQRLLVESRATAAAAALEATARGHDDPRARLHAAWTLAGLRSVDPALVQQLLADPHPRVRRQALAIAEDVLGPSELATASILLIGDDDPAAPLPAPLAIAAAIAAAEDTGDAGLDEQIAGQALQRVIELDLDDPWLRRAALAVLAHRPEATLARVVTSPPWADAASLDEPSRQLLEQLATSLGAGRGSTALA
ncbi:MAG: hypothetical protein R3190_09580, partial [Thermoanaerobaculia bacterium]|nr:hypothetical protein [Thermoanaerobaculia bacterium]